MSSDGSSFANFTANLRAMATGERSDQRQDGREFQRSSNSERKRSLLERASEIDKKRSAGSVSEENIRESMFEEDEIGHDFYGKNQSSYKENSRINSFPIDHPDIDDKSTAKNRKSEKQGATFVSGGVTIKGNFSSQNDAIFGCVVNGDITCEAKVEILNEGFVSGNISADSVYVFGQVVGDIYAARIAVVASGARVNGSLLAERIVIEDGAFFEGSCRTEYRAPDKASDKLDALAVGSSKESLKR